MGCACGLVLMQHRRSFNTHETLTLPRAVQLITRQPSSPVNRMHPRRPLILSAWRPGSAGRTPDGPGGVEHGAIWTGVDGDAAVDDWDEVAVGHGVEHGAGPGPVHTAEDEVVVQRQDDDARRFIGGS